MRQIPFPKWLPFQAGGIAGGGGIARWVERGICIGIGPGEEIILIINAVAVTIKSADSQTIIPVRSRWLGRAGRQWIVDGVLVGGHEGGAGSDEPLEVGLPGGADAGEILITAGEQQEIP